MSFCVLEPGLRGFRRCSLAGGKIRWSVTVADRTAGNETAAIAHGTSDGRNTIRVKRSTVVQERASRNVGNQAPFIAAAVAEFTQGGAGGSARAVRSIDGILLGDKTGGDGRMCAIKELYAKRT